MSQIIRCTLSMTLYSQVMQNVLHLENTTEFYTPTAIVADLTNAWINQVKGFQNPLLHYFNVAVKNMDDSTGTTTNVPVDVFGGGFFGSQTIPTNAVLVQIRTATGGRSGRGRVFIAGLHSGAYENGIWNASTVTALNSFMANVKGFLITGTGSNLRIGVMPRTDPGSFKRATDLVVGPRPGVQRRRNIGVGI